MNNVEKAIAIEQLSYFYKSNWTLGKFRGLQELTLDVSSGESFGFLGHNGAGKTTTIKCLLNLIRPTTGTIRVFGKDSRSIAAKRAVGYLPEQPYFYDHLTVREIMHMYATLAGVSHELRRQSVEEALELVRISSEARAPMRALSKGQTQRVAMAQAIVGQPRLLVLDEPFSGLDPLGRKEFADLLTSLKQGGATIFMSSHILSDVEFLCDRVSILAHGKLKGVFDLAKLADYVDGTYELVVRDFESIQEQLQNICSSAVIQEKFLRLVFEERAKAEEALRLTIASSANVESYQFVHAGLEDLFMRLMQTDAAEEEPEGGRP